MVQETHTTGHHTIGHQTAGHKTTGHRNSSIGHDVMSFAVTGEHERVPTRDFSVGTRYDAMANTRRGSEFDQVNGYVDLSIVTSLYKSASFLERFYERTCAVASRITSNFEIIFVNDGSPDNSLEVALRLQELDPRVVVIDLSRNFGEHKAVLTGLRESRGEYVFRIHCDLDEPPEVLHYFYEDMHKLGVDTVYGIQEQREGGFAKNHLGAFFYHVFNFLSPLKLRENPLSCRLMTRRYVDALLEYRDQQIFLAGLFEMVGFCQHSVTVVKKEHGTSTYTVGKRLIMTMNAITSFSGRPLLMIPVVGAIVFGLSILAGIAGGITHLSGLMSTSGWFWVIASIWGGTGLVVCCLGVMSVYMITMLSEVKNRPSTTVRRVYRREAPIQ